MLKIAYHPIYRHPLPEGHRFPMEKYDLLPQQLLHEGTCIKDNFFEPSKPNDKHILAVHEPEYYYNLVNITLDQRAARKIGFPLSEILVEREVIIADGTIKASLYALENGIAMNIAGGTHHAFPDRGEAFCLLNDQAIAAQHLLDSGQAKKILVLDLDVHQGNGTAVIFKDHPEVFTCSVHGAKNYPFRKEKSDWDLPLEDQCADLTYLNQLKTLLPKLYENVQPDFIFYLCGVDVLETDKLGRLGLTLNGCKQRDELVLSFCEKNKIPVQCSMGGGYSKDIKTIIEAHANTYRIAKSLFT